MKLLASVTICAVFVAASAGHIGLVGPSAPGVVLQGPSAKAALIGPDGSHIAGAVHGGTIVAPALPGGVVSAAVAPGYIAHHGAVPALVGLHGGYAGYGAGVGVGHWGIESGQPLIGVGSGHEGQWVPDHTEHLYDDGSYKGDYYNEHY